MKAPTKELMKMEVRKIYFAPKPANTASSRLRMKPLSVAVNLVVVTAKAVAGVRRIGHCWKEEDDKSDQPVA